jgi:3-isopropylmalate dehydratase small subunit
LLQILGDEAGIYRALELSGQGITGLSLESRMVLPNMMAESGAKNAYLAPDESAFRWVAQRWAARTGLPQEECLDRVATAAIFPDPDAGYVARVKVDLDSLEPLVACPHSPANSAPLSQVAGTPVQQAFIGTCTNGRLEDLAEAAKVLRGADGMVRRIAHGTRLLVIPASNQVLREAIALGYVDAFLEAGAMLGTPGCGPCMGNHLGVPASGETVISSANRNFRGRMGNPESLVYLASPAVVAASAVTGRITDPREILDTVATDRTQVPAGVPGSFERLREPDHAGSDLSAGSWPRFAPRHKAGTVQAAEQGPSGGTSGDTATGIRPTADMERGWQAASISGRAWVYGDDVNTDVIFPGKYTYTVRERVDMARHALEDLDPAFAEHVRPGDLIVAGRNWGHGSSREQAVICLLAAGVRVIIGASFARIYYRNAVNNGLLPVVCPGAAQAIQPWETVQVDLSASVVRCAAGIFPFQPPSESVRKIIEAGGLIEMLRQVIAGQQ